MDIAVVRYVHTTVHSRRVAVVKSVHTRTVRGRVVLEDLKTCEPILIRSAFDGDELFLVLELITGPLKSFGTKSQFLGHICKRSFDPTARRPFPICSK